MATTAVVGAEIELLINKISVLFYLLMEADGSYL
jgi:hypothetical protein